LGWTKENSLTSPRRTRRTLLAVVLVLAVIVAGVGLVWQARTDDSPPVAATPTPSSPEPVRPIVVAVSVDGLNPDALERLGRDGTPTFHRLIDDGASTLNARTAYELTVTLPNHTGMLTGRGVSGSDGHGLTVNVDPGGTLIDEHGSYVAGMFDVAHDHGLRTALLAQKKKFSFFGRTWDEQHGADDSEGDDDGHDKIDIELTDEDAPVVEKVQDILTHDRADLVFLHLRAPDKAGHAHGWLGPEYLDAVRSADSDLGRILSTIDASPDLTERVTILLTADHGGPEGVKRHDDLTLLANYRIPFIAWGRGVSHSADLYGLNDDRRDPGTSRPGYDGPQPIRNLDIEATALSALGLPALTGTTSSQWPGLHLH